MRWYAGSDHAGFSMKRELVEALRALGDEVVDVGTHDGDNSVDYPDFAEEVARRVAADAGALGLIVCGTGIGVSIVANKVPGVRAARVTDGYSARLAREHNDANVLCLGERVTGPGAAHELLRTFRDTPFAGGRHERRVAKINQLDRR